MDRRGFLVTTGMGAVCGTLTQILLADATSGGDDGEVKVRNLNLFSKHLQFLDFTQMAESAAALGFDGVDLTVRPGGHVEPENFERDLPAAVRAINAAGLKCEMMSTVIASTDNPRDFDLLALARSIGITSYRTGWLRYDRDTHPYESIEQFKRQMIPLAKWNDRIGITGMYQNYSGAERLGASVWDAYLVFKDVDPDLLGLQFDIWHATMDGARMWPNSFRLVQSHIRSLVLKDFKWTFSNGEWDFVSTPIGVGMVDFRSYFRMLKKAEMSYPISMHCEYDLGGAEHGNRQVSKTQEEILASIKGDVVTVRQLWENA